jgi:plastocyanin
MARPLRRLLAAAAAGLALAGAHASAQETGTLRGSVVLAVEGVRLADVGPVVVYLEPAGGGARRPAAAAHRVHQKNATFSPGFLAIAVGQTVEMWNDDAIYHNVFSVSKPNDFDLGIYPSGTSRAVTFRHPGVVRTYCSIHESMRGTIFVSPSPYFATLDGAGRFSIRGVPPGRHRVRTWCERLPDASAGVEVHAGRTTNVELTVGESAP